MTLEPKSTNLPSQNLAAETVKVPRTNWFKGYQAEKDVDVFESLPADDATEEW